jgi:hypothetical protein
MKPSGIAFTLPANTGLTFNALEPDLERFRPQTVFAHHNDAPKNPVKDHP